jgi:hypothetical protein
LGIIYPTRYKIKIYPSGYEKGGAKHSPFFYCFIWSTDDGYLHVHTATASIVAPAQNIALMFPVVNHMIANDDDITATMAYLAFNGNTL